MLSTITFEHGENTCASVPGTFCRFLGTMDGVQNQSVCYLKTNHYLTKMAGCSAVPSVLKNLGVTND